MAEKLKSAYELAMERLQASDREQGIERKELTSEQKARIAELRQEAKAKRAEIEILRRESLAGGAQADPAKLAEDEEHFQTDLRRVDSWLESKIAEVKDGGD